MNDTSELTYAQGLITDEVNEVFKSVNDSRLQPLFATAPAFFDVLGFGGLQPFCACFCEQEDLLSQWRGYAADQTGFSLGLNLSGGLDDVHLPPGTFLRKVIYKESDQRSWVRRITETWLKAASSMLDEESDLAGSDRFQSPALWALQQALVEQYLCFKHPGFSEEREWRLIKLVNTRAELELVRDLQMRQALELTKEQGYEVRMPPPFAMGAEGIEIKFRHSPRGYIPYIELNVERMTGSPRDRLPLDQVMEGPTPNAELSRQSLEMFLRYQGFGFPPTQVRSSTVPLR